MTETLNKIFSRKDVEILSQKTCYSGFLRIEQLTLKCRLFQGPWAIELVAGLVEAGESSSDVAIREAEEEAGIKINKLLPICEYYNSPGGSSEKLSIFCCLIDLSTVETGFYGLESESENIRSLIIDRLSAEKAVRTGQINNAMSIIAIQWLALNIKELQNRA